MATKLYVGNLSFETTQQDLEELFGQAGQVDSISIVTDDDTGRSRGFAFVEMATNEEAQAAIQALNGKDMDGRSLKVNKARAKEDRGGRGGFGGGGGRGSFGGGGRSGGFSPPSSRGFGGGRSDSTRDWEAERENEQQEKEIPESVIRLTGQAQFHSSIKEIESTIERMQRTQEEIDLITAQTREAMAKLLGA